jgi:hypothetical protein
VQHPRRQSSSYSSPWEPETSKNCSSFPELLERILLYSDTGKLQGEKRENSKVMMESHVVKIGYMSQFLLLWSHLVTYRYFKISYRVSLSRTRYDNTNRRRLSPTYESSCSLSCLLSNHLRCAVARFIAGRIALLAEGRVKIAHAALVVQRCFSELICETCKHLCLLCSTILLLSMKHQHAVLVHRVVHSQTCVYLFYLFVVI